jgi:hypothetical protein
MVTEDPLRVLLAEVRDTFARTAWTHKTHEKSCDALLATERRLKIWQIAVTAVTSGSVLSVVLVDEAFLKVVAAILSLIATALSLYAKNFTPGSEAEKHRECANRLWLIREQYVYLIGDLQSGVASVEDGQKRRDDLVGKLAKIYATAPRTTPEAYEDASAGLKKNAELSFSAGEIDKFLPQELREPKVARRGLRE